MTPAQRRLIAAKMLEDRGPDSLEAHLRKLLDDLGLWGFHPYDSRRCEKGWPDWVVLGPGGALFRELKSEAGSLTPDQRAVGSRLKRAGLNWAVWRPRDLVSGVIAKQLGEIAGVQGQLWEAG